MKHSCAYRVLAWFLSCVLFVCCIESGAAAEASVTPTTTATETVSPTAEATVTPTAEMTATPVPTVSPTQSATPVVTPTVTPTGDVTTTPSGSVTEAVTPGATEGVTTTPEVTGTPSATVTPDISVTGTVTVTPSPEVTDTITITPSPEVTEAPAVTPSPTSTPTPSPIPTGPIPDGSTAFVNVADYLSVRVNAGTSYDKLTDADGNLIQLTPGTLVTILANKKSSAGGLWYLVSFDYGAETGVEGYVYGQYLQPYSYTEDPEFIAYLTEQGFPESYHEGLSILHSIYPQWVFEAQHTGLTWEEALDGESVLGRNLVAKDSPSSWKSTEDGAYIWLNSDGEDGGWVKFDGSNWDPASDEILAYYMDPRNFFSELAIFQFEHQTYNPDVHTKEGVQSLLDGTFMEGAVLGEDTTYADVFMEAAERSGVNPYMLVARCIQEMGTEGTSKIISGTVSGYEGLYNYFDIGAYTTAQNNLIINGLIYAGKTDEATLRPWNTRARSIIGGSMFLGSKYINIGQDTLYLQKFNVQGDYPFTHQYMSNVQAPANEASIMHDAYTNLNMALVFRIPVYEEMPETKCPRPVGDGNPNAYLKALAVTGNELTPEFSYDVLSYDLIVSAGTSKVTVTYETIADTTTVQGGGTVELAPGANVIPIMCTAENGDVVTYTLNIYRIITDETIETTYTIDNELLRGVAPGTTIATFLENFKVTGSETLYFTDASGEKIEISLANQEEDGTEGTEGEDDTEGTEGEEGAEVAEGTDTSESTGDAEVLKRVVGTGWTVYTDDQSYTIVIRGDVSGDGEIGVLDMVYIRRQLLSIAELSLAQKQAALVSGGDEVGVLDMVYIRRHLLGISSIS